MKLPEGVFREYDIRGLVGRQITEDFAYRLGRAVASEIPPDQKVGKRVAVVVDSRPSSETLARALIDGLNRSGADTVFHGLGPTPLLYYSTQREHVQGGVMVTASHNPKEYNGFKVNVGSASLFGKGIQALKGRMAEGRFDKGSGHPAKEELTEEYTARIARDVTLPGGLSFGCDAGNGSSGPALDALFKKLSLEGVTRLYFEPDGTFPNHEADPTVPANMKELSSRVVGDGLAFGLGFDGDGDRLGLLDERGELVFGDKLTALLAADLIQSHPEPERVQVVLDVKCSRGVMEYISSLGATPVLTRTGHSLVKAKLAETKAELAGEMSGHIFYSQGYYGYDDALYAAARWLSVYGRAGRSVSEMVSRIPHYFNTPELRVEVEPEERKFGVVKEVRERFREQGYDVVDIDGARLEFDEGFALVRASNTQPVLVLRFEAKTEEGLARFRGLVRDELARFSEVKLPEEL